MVLIRVLLEKEVCQERDNMVPFQLPYSPRYCKIMKSNR